MKISIVKTDKKQVVHLTVKPMEWFVERIKCDAKSGIVGRFRQQIALFRDTSDYEMTVPIAMVCPAVELTKTENGRLEIVAFNNLVTLHVGGLLRPTDIVAVKESAKLLPMTLAAFEGADGRSVEILVTVANENGILPMTEQEMDTFSKTAYAAASSIYNAMLPHAVEQQYVTARSSFRLPLDPQPYFNPSPTPLKISTSTGVGVNTTATTNPNPAPNLSVSPDFSLYAIYEQMYQRAVEETRDAMDGVGEDHRWEAYLTDLSRRLCEMGVPEEETFLHMHNHHVHLAYYDEDTVRSIITAVYAETKPKSMEVETVSREARRIINFLNTRYVFRFNTVMGYTEYRPNNSWVLDWQPCDENAINGMTIEARLANIDVRDNDVRRYVRSNLIRPCNPVGEYLVNCSDKWDGTTDHIAMLAQTVPCDLPQWQQWFRKWFLSMVAQWMSPNQEYGNSVVPLLISAQGEARPPSAAISCPKSCAGDSWRTSTSAKSDRRYKQCTISCSSTSTSSTRSHPVSRRAS